MPVTSAQWKGGIVLKALPVSGECMHLMDICDATGLPRDKVVSLIAALSRNGLVSRVHHTCYRRTPAGDAALHAGNFKKRTAARKSGLRDKLWTALRMLRKATIPELLELIDTSGRKDPAGVAADYLLVLRKAGVTAVARRRIAGTVSGSTGFAQHILVRDLGPRAPQWRPTIKQLIDPNNGGEAIRPQEGGDHV
jgi:hypothetical protein